MGLQGGGFVGLFHNTQYERYARDLARQHDEPLVLTGAADALLGADALERRHGSCSGATARRGSYVYNNDSVDPDGELTLALVHLGYKVIAAP